MWFRLVSVVPIRDVESRKPLITGGLAAVLFDMDGTLVDSETVWEIALRDVATQLGGTLSPAAWPATVGRSTAESVRILLDDLGQSWRDPAEGTALLVRRACELFALGLEWRPGAHRLLREVRAAGIPTALVTSTARSVVEVALDTLGQDSFDVVVCDDEVARTKPDPLPYLTAVSLLDVAARQCVAIEDSPSGIESARGAGAVVIAVPSEVDLANLDDVILLDSLEHVDVAQLKALVTTH